MFALLALKWVRLTRFLRKGTDWTVSTSIVPEESGGSASRSDSKRGAVNKGAIIGGVTAAAGVIAGAVFLLRYRQTRLKHAARKIIDPLVFSPGSIANTPPGTIVQVKSQRAAEDVPSNSLLYSKPFLSSLMSIYDLKRVTDTLLPLEYPLSTAALREKQILSSEIRNLSLPTGVPNTPEASIMRGDTQDAGSAQQSDLPSLRREIEDFRRTLQVMRTIVLEQEQRTSEAPPSYDYRSEDNARI